MTDSLATRKLRVSFAQGGLKGTVRAVIDALENEQPWSGRDGFCVNELKRALDGLEKVEREASTFVP